MAKKVTQLDKVNNHLYSGQTVYFGTKHGKAAALGPLFAKIGLTIQTVEIDTDEFGTFTGEVERVGSVREVLRKKAAATLQTIPNARLVLASEGSFGPHPLVGLLQSDFECLLFLDNNSGIEIFAEELTTETNHSSIELGPRDDLKSILTQIGFPDHAVIVQPKGNPSVIFKNIQSLQAVGQAIIESFQASPVAKVILRSDMRANFNPTRMKAIARAGEKLLDALTTYCPECRTPGFSIQDSIPGLPCEECGESTSHAKAVIWKCVKCTYAEQSARPDGISAVPAVNCEFCNP